MGRTVGQGILQEKKKKDLEFYYLVQSLQNFLFTLQTYLTEVGILKNHKITKF